MLPYQIELNRGKIYPFGAQLLRWRSQRISITGTLIRSSSQQNIASSPEARSESPTEIPELNEVVPPQQPDNNKQPKSQPKLKDPLSSAKRLPPPPAVDTPKPKPNIPDPADYPLSDIARQSGFDNLAKSETETSLEEQTKSTVAIPAETSETTKKIAEPQTTARIRIRCYRERFFSFAYTSSIEYCFESHFSDKSDTAGNSLFSRESGNPQQN